MSKQNGRFTRKETKTERWPTVQLLKEKSADSRLMQGVSPWAQRGIKKQINIKKEIWGIGHIIPLLNTHSGTLAQSSDSPQSPTVQKSETSPFSESPQSMSLLSNSKYFLSLAVEKVRFRSIALDLKEKVSYNLAYEHVLWQMNPKAKNRCKYHCLSWSGSAPSYPSSNPAKSTQSARNRRQRQPFG